MVIVYDEKTLVENVISLTNRVIDGLDKDEYKKFYLTEYFSDWISRQLILADFEVRKVLTHILSQNGDEDSMLTYNIKTSHYMQEKIFPQLIEETLMYIVCEMWCLENNIPALSRSSINVSELKSVSYKSTVRTNRRYRIN
ncbi:MAG: hypothetical protein R3Y04_05485 [Rikenellaceae bacterium]